MIPLLKRGRNETTERFPNDRSILFRVLTSELDFQLPPELVATHPASRRDEARLLVVHRESPDTLRHVYIRDLPEFLGPSDLVIRNATKVIPARLAGVRADTGGQVEGLFVCETGGEVSPRRWKCMLKAKSLRAGIVVNLLTREGSPSGYSLTLLRFDAVELTWEAAIHREGAGETAGEVLAVLNVVGRPPLPPYILKARKQAGEAMDDPQDAARYQTVFAGETGGPVQGAIAAPTAGLHLTSELIRILELRGVTFADVVLHVGAGTFRPVETERLEEHRMHEEWCSMPGAVCERVIGARAEGCRVICVGTTSARAVESYALAMESEGVAGRWLSTRLMIQPGYRWRWTDGLLTNFHLPRSTLLAMVSSLLKGGASALLRVYAEAIARRYRFFSYGDAMLILPGRS